MSLSITTKSVFYFGQTIDTTNFSLDFSEGGPELKATLNVGSFTLEELAIEITRAMNKEGNETYSSSVDRVTRKITINATGVFELLVSSGSRIGTSVYPLAGFTGADRTGSTSYEGDSASGSEYKPQTIFRNYIPFIDWEEFVDSSLNEAASGELESITFGLKPRMQLDIWGITNLVQTANSVIETNATGRENARTFMKFITTKAKLEFMEDRNTPTTFDTVILDRSSQSSKGTAWKLSKDFATGVEGFFMTGKLEFRKVI